MILKSVLSTITVLIVIVPTFNVFTLHFFFISLDIEKFLKSQRFGYIGDIHVTNTNYDHKAPLFQTEDLEQTYIDLCRLHFTR